MDILTIPQKWCRMQKNNHTVIKNDRLQGHGLDISVDDLDEQAKLFVGKVLALVTDDTRVIEGLAPIYNKDNLKFIVYIGKQNGLMMILDMNILHILQLYSLVLLFQ